MVSYILLLLLFLFSGFFISVMVSTLKFMIKCTLGTVREFRYKIYCLSNSLIPKVRYGLRETHISHTHLVPLVF